MVAPVTSTIYGAPGEVIVGIEDGLQGTSAVNLDHVQTVDKRMLHRFLGRVSDEKMRDVCRALAITTGCSD